MKTFREFILEAKEKSHDEAIGAISKKWDRRDSNSQYNVQYRETPKPHVYIGYINVDKKRRRQGEGSRFVRGITRYADKHKLPVSVKPVADKGYEDKLKSFYSKQGFKDNKDKDIPHPMIRKPKNK